MFVEVLGITMPFVGSLVPGTSLQSNIIEEILIVEGVSTRWPKTKSLSVASTWVVNVDLTL